MFISPYSLVELSFTDLYPDQGINQDLEKEATPGRLDDLCLLVGLILLGDIHQGVQGLLDIHQRGSTLLEDHVLL